MSKITGEDRKFLGQPSPRAAQPAQPNMRTVKNRADIRNTEASTNKAIIEANRNTTLTPAQLRVLEGRAALQQAELEKRNWMNAHGNLTGLQY